MSEWEIIRHVVAIAGRVIDGQTGRAVRGGQVVISHGPETFMAWLAARAKERGSPWASMAERPDRTRTEADDHIQFMDLPEGDYTLAASLPGALGRYGTARKDVT
ncbi:MAG: hypothetical protein JRH07_07580, partial [Deltaproteobacteria bacterium]|nr:hypothetical protein [Deltaproteobacteria bacterium]